MDVGSRGLNEALRALGRAMDEADTVRVARMGGGQMRKSVCARCNVLFFSRNDSLRSRLGITGLPLSVAMMPAQPCGAPLGQ